MEDDDARCPIRLQEDHAPRAGEVRIHMAARVPFRSWHPRCAKGKPRARRAGAVLEMVLLRPRAR